MFKNFTLTLALVTSISASAALSKGQMMPLSQATAELQSTSTQAAVATFADADYTEWQSLGSATLSNGLDDVISTLNYYCTGDDERVSLSYSTEVMMRELRTDANVKQLKFCKFMGYNDMIASYNPVTCMASITPTPTGMPIGSLLKENFGTTSIDFQCYTIQYSEARRIIEFNNPFFILYDNMGLQGYQTILTLPDARPEINFDFSNLGMKKSTEKNTTVGLVKNGVDHVRYITSHSEVGFSTADLTALIYGTCEYKEAKTDIAINFDQGYGFYRILAAAFDADNKYMGIFRTGNMFSNLSSEGTWQSIGQGVWHHPYITSYDLFNPVTGELEESVNFPEDKLSWKVEIEKRTDTDREIYRVVNPYSPECPLTETFSYILARINGLDYPENRPNPYFDDTCWFVFDVTEPGNFTIEYNRPTGTEAEYSYWMGSTFHDLNNYTRQNATYADNRVCFPFYDNNDLIIELPDQNGVENITIDNSDNTPVEYFDLQGRRVLNPGTGLYLRRQGSRCTKVNLR